MTIIDAVKRLERAGGEHTRTTGKLREAARQVALEIQKSVPEGVDLPRGYRVVERGSNIGREFYLESPLTPEGSSEDFFYVDGPEFGAYLHGDFGAWIPGTPRSVVLRFAADIAGGLLDEITVWLEARAAEDTNASATLEATTAR